MHQFNSFASPCDDVPGRRDPNRRAQASQAGGHYTRNTCNLSPPAPPPGPVHGIVYHVCFLHEVGTSLRG